MMLENDFTNDIDAMEWLIANIPVRCGEQLVERYQAARAEGLDIDDAIEKCQLLHEHLDHGNGINNVDLDAFPYKTDEEMEHATMYLIRDFPEKIQRWLVFYRQYRSWGMNIFFAGQQATERLQFESWAEQDEKILKEVEKLPADMVRDLIVSTYKALREDAEVSPQNAIRQAMELAEIASSLQSTLGKIIDFSVSSRLRDKE